MKLFYAAPSPFARKARIVARELGLMDRIEEVAANPFQDDPRLLSVNPAGLIPALLLDDGAPLIDSTLICQYFDTLAPEKALIPQNAEARWRVLNRHAMANAILDFAVAAVYERRRTDTPVSQAFIDRKLEKIERCLASFPDKTGRGTDAETLTLDDITIGSALSYLDFRHPQLAWRATRPDLDVWHSTINARPSFQDTRPAEHAS